MITLERFPSVSSGITIRLLLLWLDGSASPACFSKVATANFESLARLLRRRRRRPGSPAGPTGIYWDFHLWRFLRLPSWNCEAPPPCHPRLGSARRRLCVRQAGGRARFPSVSAGGEAPAGTAAAAAAATALSFLLNSLLQKRAERRYC